MENEHIGEITIAQEQFTRWDEENFPQCDNDRFLEYDNRSHGTSRIIISYGYKWKKYMGDGCYQWGWIEIRDAKVRIDVLAKFPKAMVIEKTGYGPYDFDGFVIFEHGGSGADPIGTGETEAEAWENAAARVM